jgi:aldose 1-epimerase
MSLLISHAATAAAGERADFVTLRSVDGSTAAEFVLGANMVCRSLRYLEAEYLHQGAGVEAYAQDGITMGIPLLHPWANRLSGFHYQVAGEDVALPRGENVIPLDDVGLPIHGVMPGLLRWDVARSSQASLTSRLRWTSAELLRLLPFPHDLTVEARLDPGALTIATILTPIGGGSVPASFGYHPYLRIPEQPRSRWQVRLGARQRLLLDQTMIPTGAREPVSQRSFTLTQHALDDSFDALEDPASFAAAAGDVALKVEFLEGYSYAQVYAPADQDFICFEPMTAPTNALISGNALALVAPGQQHRAAFRISIARTSRPGRLQVAGR